MRTPTVPRVQDNFSSELQRLGSRLRSQDRKPDLELFRKLQRTTRAAEIIGRICLLGGSGPGAWFLGMSLLAYYFSVEAQLNHTVMHGAFRGTPGAEDLNPGSYDSLALPFQSKTWGEAHAIHHRNPSLIAKDPDTIHALFRVHATTPWRWWHRLNVWIGALTTFECWSFDYDRFLKSQGCRSGRDRSEIKKFSLHIAYQYVFFSALAGESWWSVFTATICAGVLRNLIFTGLQTASSVGHSVSTAHALAPPERTPWSWNRFQVETSKNYDLPTYWRSVFGGLDRHIEHHLYPDVPPSRLHEVSKHVRSLCRTSGVRYQEFPSFWSSLGESLSYLKVLGRKPGPADQRTIRLRLDL